MSTRKLRRRPNDPVPIPEKRRKPASPDILSFIPFLHVKIEQITIYYFNIYCFSFILVLTRLIHKIYLASLQSGLWGPFH